VMENTPTSTGTASKADRIRQAVKPLVALAEQLHDWEQRTLKKAAQRFELEDVNERLLSWLALPSETFVSRAGKLNSSKHPAPSFIEALAEFQQKERERQVAMLGRQLEMERKLAGLVEEAYGLTPEERELLRATRPVRDPIDVLETKIAGKPSEEPEILGD
jgi:hypothetical protein